MTDWNGLGRQLRERAEAHAARLTEETEQPHYADPRWTLLAASCEARGYGGSTEPNAKLEKRVAAMLAGEPRVLPNYVRPLSGGAGYRPAE